MSEFLGIDIKKLDDGGFHLYQNGFIRKVLESTGMEHYNGFPTPTRVEDEVSIMPVAYPSGTVSVS